MFGPTAQTAATAPKAQVRAERSSEGSNDRASRAQNLVAKLSAEGIEAKADDDNDVIFRTGGQAYMLSTEKAHFFRLERPTRWTPRNGAERTDMLRTLSKLNTDRRWVKFSFMDKSNVVVVGIEQLVATDDDIVSLLPRALEYMREADKKLPSKATRTPAMLGDRDLKAEMRMVSGGGPVARHYAEMLREEGTAASIDDDGDVIFNRDGIKLFVSVHEDAREYMRVVSLWGGEEFHGDEARKLDVCNDINTRIAVAKCSVLNGNIVLSSEQMIADESGAHGQLKGGVRAISAAAKLLRRAASEEGDASPVSSSSGSLM